MADYESGEERAEEEGSGQTKTKQNTVTYTSDGEEEDEDETSSSRRRTLEEINSTEPTVIENLGVGLVHGDEGGEKLGWSFDNSSEQGAGEDTIGKGRSSSRDGDFMR